jgi:hypothetical protein
MPIGFLSFVGKGGYRAIEIGASEMYPANASFKIGVKALYTSIGMSYNPDFANQYAWSAGFGSIIRVSNRAYVNIEALSQHNIGTKMQRFVTLNTVFGYSFSERFSLVAGPTVVWSSKDDNDNRTLFKPVFSIYSNDLDNDNRLHVGARAALRYTFH